MFHPCLFFWAGRAGNTCQTLHQDRSCYYFEKGLVPKESVYPMYNRNLVQLWVGLWCVRHDLWHQWLLSDSVTWQQRWTNLLKVDFGLWKMLSAICSGKIDFELWDSFLDADLFWFVQGWTIGKRVTLTNTLGRMSWALAFYLILANHQPLKYINILPRINFIMESESFDFKGLASYCKAETTFTFHFFYFNIVKCFLKHW